MRKRKERLYPLPSLRMFLVLAMLLPVSGAAIAFHQDNGQLLPGLPVERDIAAGDVHAYRLPSDAKQFLRAVIGQQGINVAVKLIRPDGKLLIETDRAGGNRGAEVITVILDAAGDYHLEVRAQGKDGEAGRYEAKIAELRAATPQDNDRIAAEQAFDAGDDLLAKGSEEDLKKAFEKFHQALLLYRALGDKKGEGAALDNMGWVTDLLGDKRKAIEYYEQALPARRAAGDGDGENFTLLGLGLAYNSLGERQKAIEAYQRAFAISQELKDASRQANALNNIGGVYWAAGEYQKALDYYNRALPLHREAKNRQGEASILNNTGDVYRMLGDADKALEYFHQALAIRREIKDRRGEATSLQTTALVYQLLLNDQQKALETFNQALEIRKEINDRVGQAYSLGGLGETYAALGQPHKALEHHNQSLALWRAVGVLRGEAQALLHIGAIHAALGESDKALEHYEQSLAMTRALGEQVFVAQSLHGIARIERDRGNLPSARTKIEEALDIVESLRSKVAGQELRSSYFASVREYYDFHIDLLMRMHERNPAGRFDAAALQASERARARSLLEMLNEAGADIRQGVPAALLEREREVRQQLNDIAERLSRLLGDKKMASQVEDAREALKMTLSAHRILQALIRDSSPRYAALTQPEPLGLKEIQTLVLDADTILLEYALGKERSYLWAVTTNSIASYALPKQAEIEEAARRVYESFSSANASDADAAARLSQMILGPVADRLGTKRLLIVAEGALQYIPFGALPSPVVSGQWSVVSHKTTDNGQRTTDKSLIVDHEIISLPSASTLAVLRLEMAGRKPAPKEIAILADPVFGKDDPRVLADAEARANPTLTASARPANRVLERSAGDVGMGARGFERLLSTRREAEEIVSLARADGSLKALDFAASLATATGPQLSQYRVVHFATHGLLNSRHPELSGLVLSLVNEQGQSQNGFLRAHEVYNLKLGADLVVLSGCQTALGKDVKGEGLVGLTRGFMYAGAPRVVASMWRVPDRATAELMKHFYTGMFREGLRPAAALRAAQVAMSREKRWAAPYYWAAFTLQGEWK